MAKEIWQKPHQIYTFRKMKGVGVVGGVGHWGKLGRVIVGKGLG